MRSKLIAFLFSIMIVIAAGTPAYAANISEESPKNEITTENTDIDSTREAIQHILESADKAFSEMNIERRAQEQAAETEPVETEEVQEETEVEAEETQQEETKPAETKPAETKPAETKPAETSPAETKPAETKPAATTPAATKPAATKPAETKPAATTPAATQPVQTQPATTAAPQTTAAPAAAGLTADQQNRLTAHLHAAINGVRASVGMPGYNLDGGLVSIAAVRANEASVLWSHTRPDGSRGIDMIPANKWRGENLSKVTLAGFDGSEAQIAALAQRITNNWVNSAGHYANLVKGEFTNIGLYTYVVNNGNTMTLYTAAMFSN